MSNYRSMIDQALEAARARAHTPVETVKTASASDALVKEASDLANALEFISMSASGGDNAAGFRQEMIRDFYKSATSPAQGPTMASGVQGQAPAEGKKKLNPKGLVGGNSPAQSSTAPEAKDGEKTMLESFKQAESASLYDVLMGNKTAGMGGPAEHDSETSAGVTTANENSTYKQTLHTNEGPVNANRRDLKKSTRARLQEAFAHTSDTLGDATAAQIFPNAAAKGNLKIAMDPRAAAALAGGAGSAIPLVPFTGTLGSGLAARHVAPDSMSQEEKDRLGMAAAAGSLTGGTLGRLLGGATGTPVGYHLGKITGSAGGGALGAHLAMREKQAGAIGGALLGVGVGAAASEKGKRGKGALIGGVTGGAIGAGGKHLRKRAIDKATGTKAPSMLKHTREMLEAAQDSDPDRGLDRAEKLQNAVIDTINKRRAAYESRRLKGATGVAAGAGAAGAAAAGTGRFKKKESSEKKASAADRLRWMMS